MIKLLFLALVNINSPVLVEQANFDVTQVELDAAMYDIPETARHKIAYDKSAIEALIFNHLKYEFMYDYLVKNDLLKQKVFETELNNIDEKLNRLESTGFSDQLNYDKEIFLSEYHLYLKKKYFFNVASTFFKSKLPENQFESFLNDYLKTLRIDENSGKTSKVTVIELMKKETSQDEAINILKNLHSVSEYNTFVNTLESLKDDVQLKYRDLTLDLTTKIDLPFAEELFLINDTGFVKQIFSYKDFWYLVRVNDIFNDLNDYKLKIKEVKKAELEARYSQDKVQEILNSYQLDSQLKINDAVNEVFERYKITSELTN